MGFRPFLQRETTFVTSCLLFQTTKGSTLRIECMTTSHSPMTGTVATEIYLEKVGKSQGIYNKWLKQAVFRKFNYSVQ